MTKKEAIAEFNEYILPEVRRQYGRGDYVAIAEAWNNYTDMLRSDGRISRHQYNTWGGHPADRRPNPIGAGGAILIIGAIVGGILLLTKKSKAEEKKEEAPTLGPPPIDPNALPGGGLTPSTATPQKWLPWDGCFKTGKTYRLCQKVPSEPLAAATQAVLGELNKLGFSSASAAFDKETSTFCVKGVWTQPEQCGNAQAAKMAETGTSFQVLG